VVQSFDPIVKYTHKLLYLSRDKLQIPSCHLEKCIFDILCVRPCIKYGPTGGGGQKRLSDHCDSEPVLLLVFCVLSDKLA
jgi:hypothetical protein